LENLNEREDINRAWENITENTAKESLGLDELKQHKPLFHEEVWQAETIFPALK